MNKNLLTVAAALAFATFGIANTAKAQYDNGFDGYIANMEANSNGALNAADQFDIGAIRGNAIYTPEYPSTGGETYELPWTTAPDGGYNIQNGTIYEGSVDGGNNLGVVTPNYETPTYEAPTYEAPAYEAPSYSAPAYEAPAYEAPAYVAPAYEAPAVEAPAAAAE